MPRARHPEPIAAGTSEREAISSLLTRFFADRQSIQPQLSAPDEAPLDLPLAMYEVFKLAATILSRGDMVSIVPVHRLLTTQEAASLLGVSREFVRRELRDGHLPSVDVGRHHRISFADLVVYRDRRDARRREALANITRLGAEVGDYFSD